MKTINYLYITALIAAFVLMGIFFTKEGNKAKTSSMQALTSNNIEKNNIIQEEKKILEEQMPQLIPLNTTPLYEEKKLGLIKVHLPQDASVIVNGKPTYSTGPYRIYDSELSVGKNYNFKIVVSYMSGKSEYREIKLTGGQEVVLNFSE